MFFAYAVPTSAVLVVFELLVVTRNAWPPGLHRAVYAVRTRDVYLFAVAIRVRVVVPTRFASAACYQQPVITRATYT